MHETRAAGLGDGVDALEHRCHPLRFTGEVAVVSATLGASFQQQRAVLCIGPHGADHGRRLTHHCFQLRGVATVRSEDG